jgi:putative ABC transport system permease protein
VSAAGGATNTLDFDVVGVFQTFSKDYDARAVRIPLATAQELLATSGAHTAVLSLRRTSDTDAVAMKLAPLVADSGLELKTWVELSEFYLQTVDLYRTQFGFLVMIVLIMLLLSVSTTINLGIFERVGEFGTLQALGNRPWQVFLLIVAEAFALGAIGSVVGTVGGILLALGISAVGIPMPPPPNADLGYTSHILVVPSMIAIALGTGVVAAVLASLLPARQVSRMGIAEALREAI